jgi:hypothetical protein
VERLSVAEREVSDGKKKFRKVLYQFKFVIFTLDIEGYDVSNVEKYLVRVLYRDDAECVDVISTSKVFKNPQ